MNIITSMIPRQRDLIPAYIEKWKAKCTLTTPIFKPGFEQGLRDLHEEIGLEAPHDFIYYRSPLAMWRDFEVWKPKITQVLTEYWSYQIPLCDPESMHHRWSSRRNRSAFNFAAKRYSPGANIALCETQDSDESWGRILGRNFHLELWRHFKFSVPFNWRSVAYGGNKYQSLNHYLQDKADEEDPGCQVHYEECCYLGAFPWLLHELACVDFCHHVLDIPRNERLYSGLEAIVEHGSICGIFGQVCVACERPAQIEVGDKSFNLTFHDGEVFIYEQYKAPRVPTL